MALDAALFTLHFVRRQNEPWIVDIYPSSQPASNSLPPPVPAKDNSGSSTASSKPTAFFGTIPDVAAQRALALESTNFAKQTPSYTRVRAINYTQYSTILLDGLLPDYLLASVSQPYANGKKKSIQLYNPDSEIELEKKSMTFQQSWRFHFGDVGSQRAEEFSWKREGGPGRGSSTQSAYVCEVIRKPDPSVLVAQYRPPSSKGKPGTLQLMDYNINRIEVDDKKGLEVALVMSLSALLDQEYDERIAARGERSIYVCSNGIPTDLSAQGYPSAWREAEMRHQAILSRTMPATAAGAAGNSPQLERNASESSDSAFVDRIANLEPNEVLITKWGSIDEYISHSLSLLRCDGTGQSMYMISLLSDSAETTPKLVQIAAAVKAAYYRLSDDAKGTVYGRGDAATGIQDELYQYVQTLDDENKTESTSPQTEAVPKRRIIKLDAPSPTSPQPSSPGAKPSPPTGYKPPEKMKIILSKERIGELEPKKQDDLYPASGPMQGQGAGGSTSQTKLQVPGKPPIPSRPVSPARPPQQQPQSEQGATQDKMGKGKALLSKLGIHH